MDASKQANLRLFCSPGAIVEPVLREKSGCELNKDSEDYPGAE